jgi:hypothetical protein
MHNIVALNCLFSIWPRLFANFSSAIISIFTIFIFDYLGYSAVNQALSGLSETDSTQHPEAVRVINIEPHPEIFEKKKELMQQLAMEKMAVREAKGSLILTFTK